LPTKASRLKKDKKKETKMFASYSSFALALALLILGGVNASAQTEATVVGTVADESKAMLPGATVTATELSTGRQFVGVTDNRGAYRLVNLQPGVYRIQAELQGFSPAVVPKIELLVGQNATLPFTVKVAGVAETVTVTGESPLVDMRSAQVAGNVDRRQMEELPILGRNWMELGMLVKGVTVNAIEQDKPQAVARNHEFQLNLDGQQITQLVASSNFGQPKLSREAIAEFQIVTNLFDVTQGRSIGVQVQAISRSGTNNLQGTFYGNFRDDRFNAADHIAKRVLPFQNRQVGGSVGGPVVRDKTHYFFTYEYEVEPATIFSKPPALPSQSFTHETRDTNHSMLARVDHVLSSKDQLMVRGSFWNFLNPFTAGSAGQLGTFHLSEAARRHRDATNALVSWTRILNQNAVQEVRIGFTTFFWSNLVAVEKIRELNFPGFQFPGLLIGGRPNFDQSFKQATPSIRYDLTWHRGRHDVKLGGEYLAWHDKGGYWPARLFRGMFIFNSRPPDLEARFPADAWDDPTRWNITGLEPYVERFDQDFGSGAIDNPRPNYGVWFGDTWRATDRLTVNFGMRYDLDWGVTAPPWVIENDYVKNDIRDLNNFAPRFGFNYAVTEKADLVIRGGSGLYYGTHNSNLTFGFQRSNSGRELVAAFPYDGRPGFMQDPRRGLTAEDILSGKVRLPPLNVETLDPNYELPFTWQSSIGFQKQLGEATGIEVDLTHWRSYDEGRGRDINLFFDPATGYNLDPIKFGRPDPRYNVISYSKTDGAAEYLGLSVGSTRRYRKNFQAGVAYTVMFSKNDYNNDSYGGVSANNSFDLDAEYARSSDFQRHTLRMNSIYHLPWAISLAGNYSFGSGTRVATTIAGSPFNKPGTNRLNIGRPIEIPAAVRDRFDGPAVIGTGEVAPRNALRGLALHKVDLRVSKEIKFPGTTRLSLIGEMFNLFNHANYGEYNGQINSSTFGQPRQNLATAYVPRMGQLAFRLSF
jgi:hypothetical protein